MNPDQLKYPIGKFSPRDIYTKEELETLISQIAALPAKVEALAKALSDKQLDQPYRPEGWTARQVIHHLADSHTNAYVRIKWTITEPTPTIKAYDEKAWAVTGETKMEPEISITFLYALHAKWTALLRSLSVNDLEKSFIHPETGKHVRVDRMIALYAWHGEHHLGHLKIIAGEI